MDANGYPDEIELKKIETWDIKGDIHEFLDYVESLWHWPDWGFKLTGKRVLRLELHTGGWSGNEDVMAALQENFMFWALYWVGSKRGGHYYFKIKLNFWRKKSCKKQSKSL